MASCQHGPQTGVLHAHSIEIVREISDRSRALERTGNREGIHGVQKKDSQQQEAAGFFDCSALLPTMLAQIKTMVRTETSGAGAARVWTSRGSMVQRQSTISGRAPPAPC